MSLTTKMMFGLNWTGLDWFLSVQWWAPSDHGHVNGLIFRFWCQHTWVSGMHSTGLQPSNKTSKQAHSCASGGRLTLNDLAYLSPGCPTSHFTTCSTLPRPCYILPQPTSLPMFTYQLALHIMPFSLADYVDLSHFIGLPNAELLYLLSIARWS